MHARCEHVGPAVVAGDVEVPLGVEGFAEVAVGGDDALGVVQRACDDLPVRVDDARAAPPEDVDAVGERQREVGGNADAGMYCGTLTTNDPASIAM